MRTRYINTIVWFVLIISFISCHKEEGYDYYNVGKQSFEYVENNMAAFMSFFDLALRMNAYLEVPEERRLEMSGNYFPEYVIYQTEEGDWLGIRGQDTVFRVAFDGLSLMTETAQWRLYSYGEDYQGSVIITYSGTWSWSMEVVSAYNHKWISDAHLKINYQGEQFPRNFSFGDWTVSGNGQCVMDRCEEEQKTQIDFEIAEWLVKIADSKYLFDRGILFMKVDKSEQQHEETVRAELKTREERRILEITYQGEVYSY